MSETVLALKDVGLTLQGNAGPVEILKGISLNVTAGTSVGLVGPSGSGKSSLLMLMGGLERATSGKIAALGQDLTGMDEDQLRIALRGIFLGSGNGDLPGDRLRAVTQRTGR